MLTLFVLQLYFKQFVSSDFESFYNPLHGNCYVYNSGWNDSKQIVTATREGPKNGLEMVVNIDQMDYVKQAGSLAGIRVVILDQNQMPFPEDEGVSVGPGQLTYISLQRHEINRLGSPYGSCTEQLFDPFTSAYSAFYNVQYRAKGCEYTCYQKKIMHECGCIDFSYLNITALMENINADNMSLCQSGNFEQDECRYAIKMKFMNKSLTCDCPERCNDVIFDSFSSYLDWPMKSEQAKIAQMYNLTQDEVVTDNLLRVVIYFSDFHVHELDEGPAYELVQYLSDLCGVTGLWFGFAMMTFFEYFELLSDENNTLIMQFKSDVASAHVAID
ncbi:hypothetical protein HELRODRAFT_160533 [Helobdella robusta]|uniref:Uncharacterized protein n=1 Tax=Helobdella robusta TaxID=6412 RepID=T1EQD4_HELRO|nr:hypothetical protein HELRODRAFT_160533 [Helobdella robusta]ESO06366.1 hypothetical protein HELRODRAFT_160533 [Helobdella robusta]